MIFMADAELVRVLDYILNRSDANSIEAIAAAVVRRKRDLSLFGSAGLPDPKRWAQKVSSEININASLEGIRNTVRNMVSEMLKREAPELSDEQREELLNAWVPDQREANNAAGASKQLPSDVLATMVHQFIAFSTGIMAPKEDAALRKELGAWPERYWESFPPLIRSLITNYLNGTVSEEEFASKLRTGLQMVSKS
ncbi:hypothetical protein [Gracilinema caldarium]|uniref:hypothetical protein n=1 Tax=Gracilinema caldarium TaxID=215591 RepID=UPI0026F022FD|nr:hypothetical protein [Gracilinema caldarium]